MPIVHTNFLAILDLDPMQGPIHRNLQLHLQLMLINQVRRHNFVYSTRYLDGHAIRNEISRIPDMSQLPLNDRGRKVGGRVLGDAR